MASKEKVRRQKGKTHIPTKTEAPNPASVALLATDNDSLVPHLNENSEADNRDGNNMAAQNHGNSLGSMTSLRSVTSSTQLLRSNKVEPASLDQKSNQGSSVSLKSREAWSETGSDSQIVPLSNNSEIIDTNEKNEAFAYIPYMYAKQCITRVVEDMKSMKNKHVRVVGEIDKSYRAIEDETQAHFDAFVINLQSHYNNKVKVFRQVVEVHRQELNEKQQYWDSTLKSYNLRNKTLLNEKKKLLMQNKLEFDRLKHEKEDAVAAITDQLDQKEQERLELKRQYEEKIKILEKENEKLGGGHREERLSEGEAAIANLLEEASENQIQEVHEEPQVFEPENSQHSTTEPQTDSSPDSEPQVAASTVVVAATSIEKLLEEKDEQISKLQQEKKSTERDLKKILKQQMKLNQANAESGQVKKLLEVIVAEVIDTQKAAPDSAVVLENRLQEAKSDLSEAENSKYEAQEKYDSWALNWTHEHGKEVEKKDVDNDEEGKSLFEELQRSKENMSKLETLVKGLTMLLSGEVPAQMQPVEEPLAKSDSDVSPVVGISGSNETKDSVDANTKLLEEENEALTNTNEELMSKIEDLERQLEEAHLSSDDVTAHDEDHDAQELAGQLTELQQQLDEQEKILQKEKEAHTEAKMEVETLKQQLGELRNDIENIQSEQEGKLEGVSVRMQADIDNLKEKLKVSEERVEELEAASLANIPIDSAKEISTLKFKMKLLENEKDETKKEKLSLETDIKELQLKLKNVEKKGQSQQTNNVKFEKQLKDLKSEKDKEIASLTAKNEKKEAERRKLEEKKIAALEKKISQLQVAVASGSTSGASKTNAKQGGDSVDKGKLQAAKTEIAELKARVKQVELELKSAAKSGGGSTFEAEKERKKQEKVLKELEKMYEAEKKKNEKNDANIKKKDDENGKLTKENKELDDELKKMKTELSSLGVAAKEGLENAKKVKSLEAENKKMQQENKVLTDNFNAERVLRKKYYNMVEDMKGKIRVFCRVRPMSKSELDRGNHSVCKSPDEYSISIQSDRGPKDFQFDQIFMPETTQEKVFEDTNNLVQSAIDGYNVCIFAYGQTGSGKTFTIIGDKAQNHPGVAPRAFQRIFELVEENKSKFSFKVSVYMLELYNDRLLDLFAKNSADAEEKMEIKKDKKGMVVVQGAEIKYAKSGKDLYALFEEGSKTRHVASTNMNAESSRSHLVVGIVIESTNKTSGQVVKGKLSLVDLAGSERASKTGATAQQLKEAMSINKSLSALGDVISALSSEQSFIPYRNNKLTMLMQDSLGGNAKTLMFVNVSPADYNTDETVTSLTYASRVKLITNDASKNSESKEISRLKSMISKMKKGDKVEEDEI